VKQSQPTKGTAFQVTGVHDRILKQAFYPFHFLTAPQVTRLLYSMGTIKTVQAHLKKLADASYLHSFHLPTPEGQRPFVYCLGRRGKKYLEDEGLDTAVYYLPSEQEQKSYGFLMHTLELNDFLITASLLPKSNPTLSLFNLEHDLLLKRTPLLVTDGKGKTKELIPDAWLEMRQKRDNGRERRYCFWVELDRGSHNNQDFREKLADTLRCIEQGGHTKRFGVQAVIVCFATTAGAARLEKMRQLARMELGNSNQDAPKNRILKFGTLPPYGQPWRDAVSVFCQPMWYSPYGDTAGSLIET
jgi:Replication-relaxation